MKHVPPLAQLKALLRLDISDTSIEKAPQCLKMLINLKWLDLSGNNKLTLEPSRVLPGLTNLQYLDLRCPMRSANIEVKVEYIQGMRLLECFAGSF